MNDKRRQEMIEMHRDQYSFSEIANYFGISKQRVSQLIGYTRERHVTQSTEQLFAAYNYIMRHYADKGYVPSIRDIVDNTDYKSTSSVNDALQRLDRIGWIKRDPIISRGYTLWRVTERGLSPETLMTLMEMKHE